MLIAVPLRAQSPADRPWISPKLVQERIQWLHRGPWGANDERGEGILLTNPTVDQEPMGLLQEFTFHDESALELRFYFREHDVDVSYRFRDIGSASVPPEGSHAFLHKVENDAWHFEFRTTTDLNGSPTLAKIEFLFEDPTHFTEIIEWTDRGRAVSQVFHFRNYGLQQE